MQSNFELSCKSAREAIAVPAISLDTIRTEARNRPAERTGARRRGVLAACIASLSIVAVAAAAEMFGHVQISLNPSGAVHLAFDGLGGSWKPVRNPNDSDIQKAARAMNFPVILPTGLPNGTDAEGLMVMGPGAMQIAYNLPGASRRSNHLLFVILANPKSVAPDGATPSKAHYSMDFGQTKGLGAVRWMVGQEEVIVLKSTITAAELAHFKSAMMAQAQKAPVQKP
jgi:hypothetical protein